jgi:putative transposase
LVEHIDALREAIRIMRRRHTFQIDAMVVRHEPQHDSHRTTHKPSVTQQ